MNTRAFLAERAQLCALRSDSFQSLMANVIHRVHPELPAEGG